MKRNSKSIFFLIIGIIMVASIILVILLKPSFLFKAKNPYDKMDNVELGEINEEIEDDFDGKGDTSGDQLIDSNKITYLRKDIPILKTSMLIPQGWDIVESSPNIYIKPPKDSPLNKVQVSLYIEDSQGERNPNNLSDFFAPYKEDGFIYYNNDLKLVSNGYKNNNVKVEYDKNKFAYIHKAREGKFEQLSEIPKGIDEEHFIKQYRFVGVNEDGNMRIKDPSNIDVTGEIAVRFFQTLTGNQKSVIMSFAAPTNYKLEMDEIARVMSYSLKDEDYSPANKSDAFVTNSKKKMGDVEFSVPDAFKDEFLSDKAYYAKAYKDIFDKAYSINISLNLLNPFEGFGENNKLPLASDEIRGEVENVLHRLLYDDDRNLVTLGNESMFDFLTTSYKELDYDGVKSAEYVYYVVPNNNPAYKRSRLNSKVPISAITTLIPYKNQYLLSVVTYDTTNYDLARVYNDAILRSIKNQNK